MATADHVPLGVAVADADGQVVTINRAWPAMTGLGAPESLGHRWLRALDPEDRGTILADIRAASSDTAATHASDHEITVGGQRLWTRWWLRAATVDGHARVVVTVADTDADHALRADLHYRATHDSLTRLTNRAQFFELVERALRRHERRRTPLAVLFVDLDRFKDINDACGHAIGDDVLAIVGGLLEQAVRPGDVVARVGGDEFAILCEHLDEPSDAIDIAARVRATLTTQTRARDMPGPITATVGVALADGKGETAGAIIHRADRAMYQTKIAAEAPPTALMSRHTPTGNSNGGPRPGLALGLVTADALINELFAAGLSLASCKAATDGPDAADLVDDAAEHIDRAVRRLRLAVFDQHRQGADGADPTEGVADNVEALIDTLRHATQLVALIERERAGTETIDFLDAAHSCHRAILGLAQLRALLHPTTGPAQSPPHAAGAPLHSTSQAAGTRATGDVVVGRTRPAATPPPPQAHHGSASGDPTATAEPETAAPYPESVESRPPDVAARRERSSDQ